MGGSKFLMLRGWWSLVCEMAWRSSKYLLGYPTFERAEHWLQWRLILAHPDYGFDKEFNGWTDDLFAFAFEDSKLAFSISLFT